MNKLLEVLKSTSLLWAMIGLNTGTFLVGIILNSYQLMIIAALSIIACYIGIEVVEKKDDDNVK